MDDDTVDLEEWLAEHPAPPPKDMRDLAAVQAFVDQMDRDLEIIVARMDRDAARRATVAHDVPDADTRAPGATSD